MAAFSIERCDLDPGYCEISVKGELDLAVAGLLDEAIQGVGESILGLVVGLGDCEFIDSTGIAVILRARGRFTEEGRQLVVCCPAAQVEHVLEITGLAEDGLVYESLDAAVEGIRSAGDG